MENKESEKIMTTENKTAEEYIFPYAMRDKVSEKRYQYQDKTNITFKFTPDENNKFVFIKGDFIGFSRMISNLMNNGVNAVGEKEDVIVELSYQVKGEKVEIRVKDNGMGMVKDEVDKLKRGIIEASKENRRVIGMNQVMNTIRELKGEIDIKSEENVGTEFIVKFPKCQTPDWFVDKITIHKGDTIVILDDEILMHELWKERLSKNYKDIEVKYFTEGLEAIKFINEVNDKNKLTLLADYKLNGQNINGINVIEKCGMQNRHVLITGCYLDDIKDFNKKNNFIKMFPKMYLYAFSIEII
jgi:hypothetical protein